jgi:tRNA-dihydrouridine synthase B
MCERKAGFSPKALKIGNVVIDPPLILAPMAGVADSAYRYIMAEHGAGLVVSEMVSIQGLVRDQPETWSLCDQDPPLNVPMAVQLFGNDPTVMAEAARQVEARGAPIIDINAGCPVRKVAKQGAGASLLKDPDLLARMTEEVKGAVNVPVTVKVRLGWDSESTRIVELARRLSSSGADAITVHARTAVQFYGGKADWSWIRRVKDAVDIPVVGNGDITSPALADRMFLQTGCDAVMIGRATQGNPWILSSIASKWGVRGDSLPDWSDFYETVHMHLELFQRGRPRSSGHFRKLIIWYSKGLPGSAQLRAQLASLQSPQEMIALFRNWVDGIIARGIPFLPVKEAAAVEADGAFAESACRYCDSGNEASTLSCRQFQLRASQS